MLITNGKQDYYNGMYCKNQPPLVDVGQLVADSKIPSAYRLSPDCMPDMFGRDIANIQNDRSIYSVKSCSSSTELTALRKQRNKPFADIRYLKVQYFGLNPNMAVVFMAEPELSVTKSDQVKIAVDLLASFIRPVRNDIMFHDLSRLGSTHNMCLRTVASMKAEFCIKYFEDVKLVTRLDFRMHSVNVDVVNTESHAVHYLMTRRVQEKMASYGGMSRFICSDSLGYPIIDDLTSNLILFVNREPMPVIPIKCLTVDTIADKRIRDKSRSIDLKFQDSDYIVNKVLCLYHRKNL